MRLSALPHLASLALALAPAATAQTAEVAKVHGSTTNASDLAGISSGISGDWALLGASHNGDLASTAGAVFAFRMQADGSWLETQKLTASSFGSGDNFGRSVAISGDRAIVGATGHDGPTGFDQGAAYIFELQGGVWVEVAALLASDPNVLDQFGWSVAIDGDHAAVGSYRNDGAGTNAGKVFAFERQSDGTWIETQALIASDADGGHQFGWSVALDGSTLFVGADLEGPSGNGAGAVYVFENLGGGWVETQKLKGDDTIALDYFGSSVSIDGDVAAIGAREAESATDPFSWDEGAAYVFERIGGVWTQTARLEGLDTTASDQFGYFVGVSGNRVVIGAPDQDALGNNAGAAYLFERVGGGWVETEKLLMTDGQAGDILGRSVGISGDRVILGARGEDDEGSNAGGAYLLDVEPLSGPAAVISLAAGGAQPFTLDAGRDHANELYWILGSVSGTAPGLPVAPGVNLPLNPDGYFNLTVNKPNQAPLPDSFAGLNAVGHATATFLIPPGTDPLLAGATVNHAFVAIDPVALVATFASNPLAVSLAP